MTDWFRSWHGAPTDPKWRTVARRAGVRPGDVAAVVWVLLDRASQATPRGSIAGYDAEVIADALGFEPAEVEAVIAGLRGKDVLDGDVFVSWEKHQPSREDNSAERAKAWRERNRTQANATEPDGTQPTSRVEKNRTDTEKKEETEPSSPTLVLVADRNEDEGDGSSFRDFQKGFPRHPGIAFGRAEDVWRGMSVNDRAAAVAALPAFTAHIAKQPTTRPMSPATYLADRRWEGFAARASPDVPQFASEADRLAWWANRRAGTAT